MPQSDLVRVAWWWMTLSLSAALPGQEWRPAAATTGSTAVYDRARGNVVVFGGRSEQASLGDMWEYGGGTWRWFPTFGGPPPRTGGVLAYDSLRDRVVLFGGWSQGSVRGDTWEWDGVAWIPIVPLLSPPAREGHAMAFDSASARVILYGISDRAMWEYDGIR
jgi:hypothetical protein